MDLRGHSVRRRAPGRAAGKVCRSAVDRHRIGAPLPEGRGAVGRRPPNELSSIPTGPCPGPGERSCTGATPCADHRCELSATYWAGCQPARSSSIRRFGHIAADVSRLLAHSPPLPPCVPGATRHSHRGSHVRPWCRCVSPLAQDMCLGVTPYPVRGFLGAEIPKRLPYSTHSVITMTRASRPWLHTPYPDAPSRGAITGLSYPGISGGCPPEYRAIQVSPHAPDASRRPHQPTCEDPVRPFRAAPGGDFHPFTTVRVAAVTGGPVSVSPNPGPIPARGLGRRGHCSPQRPL
jgi:hypothetical protein